MTQGRLDLGCVGAEGRKSLVLVGFFGRGNCGDEAILQCVYEAMSDAYDIVISVDEFGAHDGFWDWYPYNQATIIHQLNVDAVCNPKVAGILVGGGGLPIGFAANQVFAATWSNKPRALAGIDLKPAPPGEAESTLQASQLYHSLFDLIAVRHGAALGYPAANTTCDLRYGGDWALRLRSDVAADVQIRRDRALICLREFPAEKTPADYRDEVAQLVNSVQSRGFSPAFLPFCAEDVRFLTVHGLDNLAPVEHCWWNPRRAKQIIASSGMVLSVGRLHPIIFAADTGVPVAAVAPAHLGVQIPPIIKIVDMAAELGIGMLDDNDQISAFLNTPVAADSTKVAMSRQRTDSMIDSVRRLFAGPKIANFNQRGAEFIPLVRRLFA